MGDPQWLPSDPANQALAGIRYINAKYGGMKGAYREWYMQEQVSEIPMAAFEPIVGRNDKSAFQPSPLWQQLVYHTELCPVHAHQLQEVTRYSEPMYARDHFSISWSCGCKISDIVVAQEILERMRGGHEVSAFSAVFNNCIEQIRLRLASLTSVTTVRKDQVFSWSVGAVPRTLSSSFHAEPQTPHIPQEVVEPGQKDSSSIIPDEVGFHTGWRWFRIGEDKTLGHGLLFSLVKHVVWPPGRRMIAESHGCNIQHHQDDIPYQGCTCGIYALKNLGDLLMRNDHRRAPGTIVLAEVKQWGDYIPGRNGYKSQYAYPSRLFVLYPEAGPVYTPERLAKLVKELEENYEVPVTALPRDCVLPPSAIKDGRYLHALGDILAAFDATKLSVDEAAERIRNLVKMLVPVETGDLKSSIPVLSMPGTGRFVKMSTGGPILKGEPVQPDSVTGRAVAGFDHLPIGVAKNDALPGDEVTIELVASPSDFRQAIEYAMGIVQKAGFRVSEHPSLRRVGEKGPELIVPVQMVQPMERQDWINALWFSMGGLLVTTGSLVTLVYKASPGVLMFYLGLHALNHRGWKIFNR